MHPSPVDENVDAFVAKFFCSLGVARATEKEAWRYKGLIALYDPPREDFAKTVKIAHEIGVKVKKVTGDHVANAKEIARRVHLRTDILPFSEFTGKSDDGAEKIIEKTDGFSQVFR